jgi:hypothetical protein
LIKNNQRAQHSAFAHHKRKGRHRRRPFHFETPQTLLSDFDRASLALDHARTMHNRDDRGAGQQADNSTVERLAVRSRSSRLENRSWAKRCARRLRASAIVRRQIAAQIAASNDQPSH